MAHYDHVVEKQPNYHLLPLNYVGKVLFEEKRAVGAVFAARETGEVTTVNTSKEIILAAGAIHTPQILQAFGIGDEQRLKRFKVEVVVDLPSVGYNFQDHAYTVTLWNCTFPFFFKRPLVSWLIPLGISLCSSQANLHRPLYEQHSRGRRTGRVLYIAYWSLRDRRR